MESSASTDVLSNPRFQSGLIRAYFDAYTRRRLIYETDLEQQARSILEAAKPAETLKAIQDARNILLQAKEKPVAQQLKNRCFALADSLFRSFWCPADYRKTPRYERSWQLYRQHRHSVKRCALVAGSAQQDRKTGETKQNVFPKFIKCSTVPIRVRVAFTII